MMLFSATSAHMQSCALLLLHFVRRSNSVCFAFDFSIIFWSLIMLAFQQVGRVISVLESGRRFRFSVPRAKSLGHG
jgi:hypothetical protein